MLIRPERPADIPAIRVVNLAAFDTPLEADLVDALRAWGGGASSTRPEWEDAISLVAEDDGAIVGHILFSEVTVEGASSPRLMGLAPMAVVPERQRQGIGTALVREGLERCRGLGIGAVVVLGHAEYYPRFGFVPASRRGLACEYDVPDDVFMVMELVPDVLRGTSGTIRYHPAFAGV